MLSNMERWKYGAMDDIPDTLNNEALWRAVQRHQGHNVAYLYSNFTAGGTGIACTIPGEVGRLDPLQLTVLSSIYWLLSMKPQC